MFARNRCLANIHRNCFVKHSYNFKMLMISLQMSAGMIVANRVKFYHLVYFIAALLILHMGYAEIKMASTQCLNEHNNISSKIEFMANCKKETASKNDSDSDDSQKHMCFIMRRYCARECTTCAYGGTCDVESIFTLNTKMESDGTPKTLDCVCTYNDYKRGCYNTYEILWDTVMTEFETNCATSSLTETKILLIGGDMFSKGKSIEFYDPDVPEKSQLLKVTLLQARYCHTSFMVDKHTVVTVGGYDDGWLILDHCEIFNPITKEVSFCKNNLNHPRYSSAVAVLKGVGYVCGGGDLKKEFASCEKYTADGIWEMAKPMTSARSLLAMAAIGRFIYAIGGTSGKNYQNSVERYNPNDASDTWSAIEQMQKNRVGGSAAALNEFLYVCGGSSGNEVESTCEVYDPIKDRWSEFKQMIFQRNEFNLLASEDRLFAIESYKPLNSVEMCDIKSEKGWIEKQHKSNATKGMAVMLS